MTKILSQLLGGQEPDFRMGLARLEKASGNNNHDIRLTAEVVAAARAKLKQLDLDPDDTNGEELYNALAIKLAASDKELARVLKLEPFEANFLDDFTARVSQLATRPDGFGLKNGAAKRIIRSNPPKKAMKLLGYRSLDSFLKHESEAGILMAAKICESEVWHRQLAKSFKKLSSSDFEPRRVTVMALPAKRWEKLAASYVAKTGHNIFAFSEVGAVVVLPLGSYRPGILTAMFLLTLDARNSVLASSSYLRFNQVKPDFGRIVADAFLTDKLAGGSLAGHSLSWRTIHNFIASAPVDLEPQLTSDSAALVAPADDLAELSPALEFWRGTSHLAYLCDNEPVSLNPLDTAINFINNLPFAARRTSHFEANLWAELWRHYLQTETLAQKLVDNLRHELAGPELVLEPALAGGRTD